MRKLSLGRTPEVPSAKLGWILNALSEIERASHADPDFGRQLQAAQNETVAAKLIGTWRGLAASASQVSHTGDTDETTLATITIPAGVMGANGLLRVTTLWTTTNNANNKTQRIKLGSSEFLAYVATTEASHQHLTVIRNRGAQNSQVGAAKAAANAFDLSTSAVATASIDTSAQASLSITGQLANAADTITLESYLVEILYLK